MDAKRIELAISFRTMNKTLGLSAQKIVDNYNEENGFTKENEKALTKGFVCGLWRDLKKYEASSTKELVPVLEIVARAPKPESVTDIDNWDGVVSRAKKGAFDDALAQLEHDNRYIKVEHDNDNHLPFPDNDALAMRSECRRRLQPDLIVCGSDAVDAPSISRFEPDKRLPAGRTLSRFRDHWQYHVVNRLAYDAPNALRVWIDGNHDARVWEHLMNDSDSYDILYDYHVDTITQGGLVHFCGTDPEALSVTVADALMVTHGTKATVHTAAGTLRDFNYSHSLLVGHSHRPDYYTSKSKGAKSAVVGGCACNLRPPYEKRKVYINWQHGYSYGVVDTWTGTTITKHVDFMHTNDSIWCDFGNEIISIKKQVSARSVAA